jgi:hypothetical protein
MNMLTEMAIFTDSGTVGFLMGTEEKVFVLQLQNKFFNDWSYNVAERKPTFFMVRHLSVARGFVDVQLAKSFQKFLNDNGHECQILEVERRRLVRQPSLDSKITRIR